MGLACSRPAADRKAADAFRGRTVRIIVGLSPGGGYDLYARVMAAHFRRHLPGEPTVVVENMPGAGGLIAANYLAHQARPDGLTIGLVGVQAVVAQFLRDPGAEFDAREFRAIGAPADDMAVCVMSRASGVDLAAWREGRVRPRLGVTNYGATGHVNAMLLSAALHLPIRPVVGYLGTSDIRMAIESGELDGTCPFLNAYLATFEPKANYVVILQAGVARDLELEGVPSASRLVRDDRGRELLDVLALMGPLARYYVVPSETPSDRTDLLRSAFEETMRDREFLQAAAAARLAIRPVSGSEVEKRVTALLSLPPEVRARITAILKGKVS
jgi:tripartite-type tricarboxylate transporter receptor subunit TctC